jgi:hypothetical protein
MDTLYGPRENFLVEKITWIGWVIIEFIAGTITKFIARTITNLIIEAVWEHTW